MNPNNQSGLLRERGFIHAGACYAYRSRRLKTLVECAWCFNGALEGRLATRLRAPSLSSRLRGRDGFWSPGGSDRDAGWLLVIACGAAAAIVARPPQPYRQSSDAVATSAAPPQRARGHAGALRAHEPDEADHGQHDGDEQVQP